MPIQKSAQISVNILKGLRELDKLPENQPHGIRKSRFIGLALYNGISSISLSYHLNKLEKMGFVKLTTINGNEKYVKITPIDFDYMVERLTKDNIVCDYDTFKRHVLEFGKTLFVKSDLQAYLRRHIHEGLTAATFGNYFQRMVNENYIENTKEKEDSGYLSEYVYMLYPNPQNEDRLRIPSLNNSYEKNIIKKILKIKDKTTSWKQLKNIIELTYGPIEYNKKLNRAIHNLLSKKYLLYNRKTDKYELNKLYDFEFKPWYKDQKVVPT